MATIFLAVSLLSLTLSQVPVMPAGGDARIAGQVVDAESHAPIAGARVMLMLLMEASRGTFGTEPRQAVSDASGQFAFDGVAAGKYRVDVQKPGFAPSPDWFDPLFDPRPFDVAAGQTVAGLQFALKKAGVVAGRILDAGGDPLVQIRVQALKRAAPSGPMGFGITMGQAETNDLGEFRIAGLAEGEYVLIAMPGPPPPFGHGAAAATVLAPTYYPGTTDRQAAQPVTLAPGQTVSGLQFPMVSTPAFQVSGTVVDEVGSPIGNVMVLLLSDLQRDVSFAPIMGQAGPDGTFTIAGIAPGSYRIMSMPAFAVSNPGTFTNGGSGGIGVAVGGVAVGGGFFPVGDAPSPFQPPQVIVENADVKGLRVVLPTRR